MSNKTKFLISGVILVLVGIIIYLKSDNLMNLSSNNLKPVEIKTTNLPQPLNSDKLIKIDDKFFTEQEIFGPDMIQYFDLKQKMYDFKLVRFRKFLSSYYLKEKADEKKLSIQAYTEKYITKGQDFSPTQKDIEDFAQQRNIPLAEIKENPQAFDQLKGFLKFKKQQDVIEKLVAEWSKSKHIETYFEPPKLIVDIPTAYSPTFGNPDAKVTVVEFSDFECPYCSKAAESIKEIKKKYKNKIKLVYKQFPLEIHKNARMLSKASICVEQLDKLGFWIFYDEVFKNQEQLINRTMTVDMIVKKMGLNLVEFQQCLMAEAADKLIDMDMQLGQQLGVSATPTFFINGRVLQGAVPPEVMSKIIDEELAKEGVK